MPKTTGVEATLLEGDDRFARAVELPGAFFYIQYEKEPDVKIIHSCPCGCGMLSGINLKPHLGRTSPMWRNSGTREKPTLTPSVGIHAWAPNEAHPQRALKEADGFHWHGWLKNGVWESV